MEIRAAVHRPLGRGPVEQLEAAEVGCVPALRERVAATSEIVVPERGERPVAGGCHEIGGRRREPRSGVAARDEIAGEGNHVGLDLGRPHGAAAHEREPRSVPRVHVGDVHHREPVEIDREARERHVAHALPERQRFRSRGRHTDRSRRDRSPFQAHH